jgi:hypothetical protein
MLGGCQKGSEIAHYRVPKELEASLPSAEAEAGAAGPADAAQADTAPTDRMLAAIVPHADSAWTFKLAGPLEAVDQHAAEFEKLVQSVTFSDQPGGQPQWKLPAGWKQQAGNSEMRFATITMPGENPALEVTVGKVPWPAAENDQRLLMNLNRWRGQMQLKPVDAAALAENSRKLKLADGSATLIDLKGKFKAGGMTPPLAGAAAGALPPGHPPMTATLPSGHPPIDNSAAESSAAKAPSAKSSGSSESSSSAAELPLTFAAPKNWHTATLPPFAVAAFALSKNSQRPEVTITPLATRPNGILDNIGRWRGQLGLPEASKDELTAVAKPYKVNGMPATWVRLLGPEGANPQREIMAAVVSRDGTDWIFAMKAEAAVADNEQANFEKFVASVKFTAPEP